MSLSPYRGEDVYLILCLSRGSLRTEGLGLMFRQTREWWAQGVKGGP